ncbi:MAG: preprotein translocase subunit SecG [Pseudomonadota bacterium]
MEQIVLAVHVLLAVGLVVSVLLQRSEGGGLGIGGGGGGGGGFMTGRGAASLMTKTTAVLAFLFICTSLGLAILNRGDTQAPSILDAVPSAPAGLGAPAAPPTPAVPGGPSAPTAPSVPQPPIGQ